MTIGNRILAGFAASLILILGLSPVSDATAGVVTVGYFTDNNVDSKGPLAAIEAAGFKGLKIDDITGFDLKSVDMLMIDESSNEGYSDGLMKRVDDIAAYVKEGGRFLFHDRYVGSEDAKTTNPFVFGAATLTVRNFENDSNIDLVGKNNPLVKGPGGELDDSSLDGGTSSAHGFIIADTLPVGAVGLLNIAGDANRLAAFSYGFGNGFGYYSTIPLDYYLDQPDYLSNFSRIYAPNAIAYLAEFSGGAPIEPPAVPEPGTLATASIGCVAIAITALRRRRGAK